MSGWPIAPLQDVLVQDKEYIDAPEHKVYPKLSVKLYGRGVVLDVPTSGTDLKMKRHQLAKAGQVILSEIWGKRGAIGIVPEEGEGALCTSHFFLFDADSAKVERKWLDYVFRANYLQSQLDIRAKGTTGYAAVRPAHFLQATIPLPPLLVQRRLVARLDEMFATISNANKVTEEISEQCDQLLLSAFRDVTREAPSRRLGEVCPLIRRPAAIEPLKEYPGVSVRSFGRGTFHNPSILGSEITWQKPHLVRAGDILISNIKAWEGAIAVAKVEDDNRYGSHRYLTYVPVPGVATPCFLCFFLLTAEGLRHVGDASPGSADRNRTTSAKALLEIPVPVPAYEQQLWFGRLFEKVEALKQFQMETTSGRAAILPAVIDRAFKGELL